MEAEDRSKIIFGGRVLLRCAVRGRHTERKEGANISTDAIS